MKEVTEEEQADKYLELLNMRLRKRYPENLFFYVAHDDPNPEVKHFGILRSDYSEKKSYNVLKDFISGKKKKGQ